MQTRPLHPLFAAEVTGLDTSAPLTPDIVADFERAMAEYAVCVVRNASLDDADHIRFSRAFGPLELPPGSRGRIAPELYDISNLDAKGEIIPFDPNAKAQPIDFERFHTDSPFNSQPTKYSFLLGYVVPPEGADTLFIDTRAVYDDLPQAMKDRIEGLVAEHDMFVALERTGVKFGDDKMRRMFPTMPHPLVRTSASGRKALYLGWHAIGIVGWPVNEAQALLDELFAFATQEKYTLCAQVAAGRHGRLGQPLHHAQRHFLRALQVQARLPAHHQQRIRSGAGGYRGHGPATCRRGPLKHANGRARGHSAQAADRGGLSAGVDLRAVCGGDHRPADDAADDPGDGMDVGRSTHSARTFMFISGAISVLAFGRIADRFGSRTILLLGSVGGGITMLALSRQGTQLWQLYLAYTLLGAFGSSGLGYTKIIGTLFREASGQGAGHIRSGVHPGPGRAATAHQCTERAAWAGEAPTWSTPSSCSRCRRCCTS